MPTFRRGDIIRVPFPYTDRQTTQRRPALVISAGATGAGERLLWVLMVTSAENRPWPGDIPFDFEKASLSAPSVIRTAKVANIEVDSAAPIGRLAARDLVAVDQAIDAILGRS